jgi:hypothetical protein
MARWRLSTAHYLNVEGVSWQYSETDQFSGRAVMKKFPVPSYFDPRFKEYWNYRDMLGKERVGARDEEGSVVVCDGNNPGPYDVIFRGDPTPDMLPLDAEAEAISASYADRWKHRGEDLIIHDYSQSLLNDLYQQLADAQTSRPTEDITELVSTMTQVMQQNTQILEKLASQRRI